jgi:hypothetical protein
MPMRKETITLTRVAVKDCWHPYGLQGLSPEKFAAVTSRILKGKFNLLHIRDTKVAQIGSYNSQ